MERKSMIQKMLREGLNLPKQKPDITTQIMTYEDGGLDNKQTLELFSELIKTGMINGLQGNYHRTSNSIINAGYLDSDGNILKQID